MALSIQQSKDVNINTSIKNCQLEITVVCSAIVPLVCTKVLEMSSNNDLSTKKLTGSRELLSGDASQKNRDADKKYNLGAAETVQGNLKQSLQSLNMNSDDEDAREFTARNDDFPPDQDVMDAYQQRVATGKPK